MSHSTTASSRHTLFRIVLTTVTLILFLMWLEGAFEPKTAPGLSEPQAAERPSAGSTARAQRRETDELFNWPGTVAALTVTQIAPKISGRLLEITVRPGNPVQRGQVLARIDAVDIQARLDQTRAALRSAEAEASRVRAQASEGHFKLGQMRSGLAAAEAEAHRARADAERMESLFKKEAATHQDLDAAQAAASSADARVEQARDAVREVESNLSQTLLAATHAADAQVAQAQDAVREAESHLNDTVLKAPFDSVVVKRNQEPGDMATPGVAVLTVQQSQYLRIEAAIPASCASRIAVGTALNARLAPAGPLVRVVVDEIQPTADTETRTVLIKARLPAHSATQPGAFAWLQQACGHESVLLVPAAAVSRIGQLESVRLVVNGESRLRHVRTGKRYGDAIEILSGLGEGDIVAIPGNR